MACPTIVPTPSAQTNTIMLFLVALATYFTIGIIIINAASKNTGIEIRKPAVVTASAAFLFPVFFNKPFAIASVAPASERIFPKMIPSPITIPMLFSVLPNPAHIVLAMSLIGIFTRNPVTILVKSIAINGFTLNLMIDTSKMTTLFINAINNG